jgi:hexosaminidase
MASACKGVIDPTNPKVYDFLLRFLVDMGSIFTEEWLFLGGDEVSVDCFDNSPTIAAWMKARGFNASQTQQYFWQQMTALVFPHLNKTVSVWRADDADRGPAAANMPAG